MKTALRTQKSNSGLSSARPNNPVSGISGRCMLASGKEYACVARSITPLGAEVTLRAPVIKDMSIICYLDNIGILRGVAKEITANGFQLAFDMSDTRRARVSARIDWHATRAAEAAEHRACPRIVPMQRETEVRLSEHLIVKATIIDLSMSGVALALDERCVPFLGSIVRLGKRFATVVRAVEGGFAAEFKLPFNRETFNSHVVL